MAELPVASPGCKCSLTLPRGRAALGQLRDEPCRLSARTNRARVRDGGQRNDMKDEANHGARLAPIERPFFPVTLPEAPREFTVRGAASSAARILFASAVEESSALACARSRVPKPSVKPP